MTKTCSRCHLPKDLEKDFFKKSCRKDGHESHCKACARRYQTSHYKRNKRAYLDKNLRHRQKMRAIVDVAKDVPCADCNTKYPPYVMDFDHLSGKDMAVSRLVNYGSEKRLRCEIAKCQVVCANCHRIRTYKRKNLWS